MYVSSQLYLHIGSFESAMVKVFTLWKLATVPNQGISFIRELSVRHLLEPPVEKISREREKNEVVAFRRTEAREMETTDPASLY